MNEPVSFPEKSKRKAKPKGIYRRRWLYVSTGVLLVLSGIAAFVLTLGCSLPPAPSQFEMTTTGFASTKAWIAAEVTEIYGTAYLPYGAEDSNPDEQIIAASPDCFYTWHVERDTGATDKLQTGLNMMHIPDSTGYVVARGKMYVCGTGAAQTTYYYVKDRTLKVIVPIGLHDNAGTMGLSTELVIRLAQYVWLWDTKEIQIMFRGTEEKAFGTMQESFLWKMNYRAAVHVMDQGKQGAELFESGTR